MASELIDLVRHFDGSRTGHVSLSDLTLCLNAVGIFPKPKTMIGDLCASMGCFKGNPRAERVLYEPFLSLVPPPQHSPSAAAPLPRKPPQISKTQGRQSPVPLASKSVAAASSPFPNSIFGANRFSAADIDAGACHTFSFHNHDVFAVTPAVEVRDDAPRVQKEIIAEVDEVVPPPPPLPNLNDIVMDFDVVSAALDNLVEVFKSKGVILPVRPADGKSGRFEFAGDATSSVYRLGLLPSGQVVVATETGFVELLQFISRLPAQKSSSASSSESISEAQVRRVAEAVIDQRTGELRDLVSSLSLRKAVPAQSNRRDDGTAISGAATSFGRSDPRVASIQKALSMMKAKENEITEKWLSPEKANQRALKRLFCIAQQRPFV